MADDDPSFRTSVGANVMPADRPTRQRRLTSKAQTLEEFVDEDGQPRHQSSSSSSFRLKLNGGAGAGSNAGLAGPGATMDPAQVGWDRELDSDPDEPLVLEEHILLRVPEHLAPAMRDLVERRELPPDVWLKFKDARRAVFHHGDTLYGAKLVDLPTLLESQKLTGVGGQTVKVADISQMLVVENAVDDEADVTRDKAFNFDDFVWPHGITPPLRHVRKRRFRKRLNKRVIEIVESATEALLRKDAGAEQVKYELVEDVGSDDDNFGPPERGSSRKDEADSVGAPTPSLTTGEGDDEDDEEDVGGTGGTRVGNGDGGDDDDDDDDGDESADEFARELDEQLKALNNPPPRAPGAGSDDEEDEEEDEEDDGDQGLFGDDDSSDDDDGAAAEDDPEVQAAKMRIKQLAVEVADLEKSIAEKEAERSRTPNPLLKGRFDALLKRLGTDLELKRHQRATAVRDLERKAEQDKADIAAEDAAAAAAAVAAANQAASITTAPSQAAAETGASGGASDRPASSSAVSGTGTGAMDVMGDVPEDEEDEMDLS